MKRKRQYPDLYDVIVVVVRRRSDSGVYGRQNDKRQIYTILMYSAHECKMYTEIINKLILPVSVMRIYRTSLREFAR